MQNLDDSSAIPERLRKLRGTASDELGVLFDETLYVTGMRLQKPLANQQAWFQEIASELIQHDSGTYASQQAQILLNCCRFLHSASKSKEAISAAKQAVKLAKSGNDSTSEWRSRNVLGVLHFDTGDIASAFEEYQLGLSCAQGASHIVGEIAVINNIASAQVSGGLFESAMESLERVLALCETAVDVIGLPPISSLKGQAEQTLARCSLHSMRDDKYCVGLIHSKEAIESSGAPDNVFALVQRVSIESTYIRLLLETKELATAKERCVLMRAFAEKSGMARAKMTALVANGLYEAHVGNFDIAESMLNQAYLQARDHPSALNDALIGLVRLNQLAKEPHKALKYLHELQRIIETNQTVALKNRISSGNVGDTKFNGDGIGNFGEQEIYLKGEVSKKESLAKHLAQLERMTIVGSFADDATGEHAFRVGRLASLIADAYGCDSQTVSMIEIAARLHDIGKIGIPQGILSKPGPLTAEERKIIQRHPLIGEEMLKGSDEPVLCMARDIARYHHQWWDGNEIRSYPDKLSGLAIPISARITALCDVYDALTNVRSYKNAWDSKSALNEISRLRGTQFDPDLTDLFIITISQLHWAHGDKLNSYLSEPARENTVLTAKRSIEAAVRGNRRST